MISTPACRRSQQQPRVSVAFASLASLVILVLASSPSAVLAADGDVTAGGYSSSDTACTRYYEVASGDTCDKIGQNTFTSTYQILAFNLPQAGPDCFSLEIGAQLCLGRYGNDCQLVHRAVEPETCDSIAANYGIDVSTLQANNPSLDCQRVYDGLVLCVAPGIVRPPPPAGLNATAIAEAGQQHAEQEKAQRQQVLLQGQQNKVQKPSTPAGGVSAQSTPAEPHRSQHRHHYHHHHVSQQRQQSPSSSRKSKTHHSTRSSQSLTSTTSKTKHLSSSSHHHNSTSTSSHAHPKGTSSTTSRSHNSTSTSKTESETDTAAVMGEQRPASSTVPKKGSTATADPLDGSHSVSSVSSSKHKSTSHSSSTKTTSTSDAHSSKQSSPIKQIVDGVLDKLL